MKIYMKPLGVLGTNCFLAADENQVCAIIDPGASPKKLIDFIEERELKPAQILLTHGHFDHIGAVKGIVEKYGIPVAVGKKNEEMLHDTSKSLADQHTRSPEAYLMEAQRLLEEGDTVQVGELRFEVLETPGHTLGCVTYRLEENLFTGDCLFAGSIGRTDFYGGDYDTLMKSIKRLAALPGDYRILPGHGEPSTMSEERRTNPYLQTQSYAPLY